MTNLNVVGRSFWHQPGYDPMLYIGAVSANPDKSNRDDDIVQSLPVHTIAESLQVGRELRDILILQDSDYFNNLR